jgi:hypothetical protein
MNTRGKEPIRHPVASSTSKSRKKTFGVFARN